MVIAAHAKLTMSGIFGTPAAPLEIWSWSLKYGVLGPDGPAGTETAQSIADAASAAYITHIKPLHHTDIVLTRVRYSNHAPGGLVTRTADGAFAQADWNGAVPGGVGGTGVPRKPLQSAVCVTLRSARAGATGRGRFFLPQTTQPLDFDYRLNEPATGFIVDSVHAFITELRPKINAPQIFSSTGAVSTVNAVAVGRVPDTMRSRRSALLEAHVVRPVL